MTDQVQVNNASLARHRRIKSSDDALHPFSRIAGWHQQAIKVGAFAPAAENAHQAAPHGVHRVEDPTPSTDQDSTFTPPSAVQFCQGDDDDGVSRLTMPLDINHASKWAITFQQLLDVEASAKKTCRNDCTMRDITEKIVIPECRNSGTSYARSKNPKGRAIGAFVTHCWDEPFFDFVDSIRTAFSAFTHTTKPNLWICAFSLVQGDEEYTSEALKVPLDESPFVLALEQATYFLVVRNSKRDLYSRAWCVCELMFAKEFGFTTRKENQASGAIELEDGTRLRRSTMVVGSNRFSSSRSSCEDADASDPEDKKRILKLLKEKHTIEEVDSLVLEYRTIEDQDRRSETRTRPSWVTIVIVVVLMTGIVAAIVLSSNSTAGPTPSLMPSPEPTNKSEPPTNPAFVSPTMPGDFWNNLPNFTIEALRKGSLPQTKARDWAMFHPDFNSSERWQQEQLFALSTFYYSFEGDKWPAWKSDKWLSNSTPECRWGDSIACDERGRIEGLHLGLQSISVSGQTPHEVFLLRSLKTLSITEVALKTPLSQLVPPYLAELQNLAEIHLTYNSLSGSLPSNLGLFGNLKTLNLKNNELQGQLPTLLGLMTGLEHLYLNENSLSGTIPSEFGEMSSLRALHLDGNELSGTMPESICLLPSLKDLTVDCLKTNCTCDCNCPDGASNENTGTITPEPTAFLQTSAPTREQSGEFFEPNAPPAPSAFPTAAPCEDAVLISVGIIAESTASDLFVDPTVLSCAGIDGSSAVGRWFKVTGTGSILKATTCTDQPILNGDFDSRLTVWSGACSSLRCLGGNDDLEQDACASESGYTWNSTTGETYFVHITGVKPFRFALQMMEVAPPTDPPSLDPNEAIGWTPTFEPEEECSGPACGLFSGNLPPYTVSALVEEESPQFAAFVWLEEHPGLDSLPEWRKRQLFAMATFYYAFSGENWSQFDKQNWLDYNISECKWGNNGADELGICDSDGNILELSVGSAQEFSGTAVPPEISMLSFLETFELYILNNLVANLSDLLPVQLAGIPLKTVAIHNTRAFGTLPSQLGSFSSLTSLDLRANDLSGTIPTELGMLSQLESLHLYDNAFTGPIPSQLALISPLQSLLLDRTDLTGAAPNELCSLSSISLRVNCTRVANCTDTCPACSCFTLLQRSVI